MRFFVQDGNYIVDWVVYIKTALDAEHWCYEQFGRGWGERKLVGKHSGSGLTKFHFVFKRLNHAQWFMLKFGSV